MKRLMDSLSINRSLTRMSHEILEQNNNSKDIVLVGIHNRGVPLSHRIQKKILKLSKNKLFSYEIFLLITKLIIS